MTKDDLIQEMLDTLEGLGYVQSARIDARVWAKFYRRKFRRMLRRDKADESKGASHDSPHTPSRARGSHLCRGAK